MSGKRYPEEFKIEAVKQVVDRGDSVASVATRLNITPTAFTPDKEVRSGLIH
jgi:transposase